MFVNALTTWENILVWEHLLKKQEIVGFATCQLLSLSTRVPQKIKQKTQFNATQSPGLSFHSGTIPIKNFKLRLLIEN